MGFPYIRLEGLPAHFGGTKKGFKRLDECLRCPLIWAIKCVRGTSARTESAVQLECETSRVGAIRQIPSPLVGSGEWAQLSAVTW